MVHRPPLLLPLLLPSLLLVACGDSERAPAAEPATELATPVVADCSGTENLLENTRFQRDAEGSLAPWRIAQHAGERSFELTFEAGELSIERIASQPWVLMEQRPDTAGLAGHELLYRSELKLDLNDTDWSHAFEPGGGLFVGVWADLGIGSLVNIRLAVDSVFEHEPHLGQHDWFVAEKRFVMPDRPTEMRIGFEHRANGSFRARNPVLLDCGPAQAPSS